MRITDINNLTKFLRNISIYLEKNKRGRKDFKILCEKYGPWNKPGWTNQ